MYSLVYCQVSCVKKLLITEHALQNRLIFSPAGFSTRRHRSARIRIRNRHGKIPVSYLSSSRPLCYCNYTSSYGSVGLWLEKAVRKAGADEAAPEGVNVEEVPVETPAEATTE
eukprot:gb/GEZN01014885.1/.p2 GENE.gb/GEZN01014885.1/~~gb/GEZN01014885.1/.p2  ORF type:complete len:113 (+),score=6.70 gb/GEZN01014885.1/:576-914(+)